MGNCARGPATHEEPPVDYQDGANQQTSGGYGANPEQPAYTGEQQQAYGAGPYDPGMAVDQQVASGGYDVQPSYPGMDGNAVGPANYGMPGADGGGYPPMSSGPSYPADGGAMMPSGGMPAGAGDGQTYATYEEAQAAADAANAKAGAGSYGGPSNYQPPVESGYQPAYQGPGPDSQPQYPSGPNYGDQSGGMPAGNAYPDTMPQPAYESQPAYDSQPQPSGGYPTADAPEMPTAGGYTTGAPVMPGVIDGGVVTGYSTAQPQGQAYPSASGVMPPASGVSPPVQTVY